MPTDILVAIDGTDSKSWRREDGSNSHTYKFYRDFKTRKSYKMYFDGPNLDGLNVWDIHDKALGQLKRLLELVPTSADVRITVVGHSRGGLIAINLAKSIGRELKRKVFFLGLYDAVDRALGMNGVVVDNVEHTAHAMRQRTFQSRQSWDNAAKPEYKSSHSGQFSHRFFMTSHGGIGGDVETTESSNMFQDQSCVVAVVGEDQSRTCESQATSSDNWVRAKARMLQLPI